MDVLNSAIVNEKNHRSTFLSNLSTKFRTHLTKIQNKILKLRMDNKIIITDSEYKELLCETYNIPYEENVSMELINMKDIDIALREMVSYLSFNTLI